MPNKLTESTNMPTGHTKDTTKATELTTVSAEVATELTKTIYECTVLAIYRMGKTTGEYNEKGGGTDGHAFSTLKIKQQGNSTPWMTAHCGNQLLVNARVNALLAKLHETDMCAVVIFLINSADWEKGIPRNFLFKCETKEEARDLMSVWNELSAKIPVLPATTVSAKPNQEVLVSEKRGECHSCNNAGFFGEVCDNCPDEVMGLPLKLDYGSEEDDDEDSDVDDASDEENYHFACTQDDAVAVLKPFGDGYGKSTSTLRKYESKPVLTLKDLLLE